jgi:predicted secreted hydrolase
LVSNNIMLRRRAWLRALPPLLGMACATGTSWSATTAGDEVKRGRKLSFPRDHGAHLAQRIEWWYLTGWCSTQGTEPEFGFQVTFFRVRTGLAETLASRFAPRHLLMAHAALTDLKAGRHLHADRLARWSGEGVEERRGASLDDAHVRVGAWRIQRSEVAGAPPMWISTIDPGNAGDWALDLRLQATQALLLQGEEGFSRKGPEASQASLYVTEPQLDAAVRLRLAGRTVEARGRAWLDHEWSDTLMPTDAVGWDWIGMNLDDGSALTAFRLRRADGSTVWAGGSFRERGASARSFTPGEVVFERGRIWRSPATNGDYPVQWRITCPAGRFEVKSLLDAQELDARASTGTVYWEGLSSLHDSQGRRVGYGYLEMTGYVGRLRF